MGTRACFQCGQMGHFAKACHQVATRSQGSQVSNYQPRQPAQARVYTLTPGNVEVKENVTNVVVSTIYLFGSDAYILLIRVLPILSFRRLM
jgi:hypothetical protein